MNGLDLLVVYEDPKREDDYSIVWDAFEIPNLEPHIYAASQYANLKLRNALIPGEVESSSILIYGKLSTGQMAKLTVSAVRSN
jgi:hypothetical protein